jgi:hypothetical protein
MTKTMETLIRDAYQAAAAKSGPRSHPDIQDPKNALSYPTGTEEPAMTYAAEIAKDIRRAVQNLKETGRLHALPEGARVTVSSSSASQYASVNVTIAKVTAEWAWKGGDINGRQLTRAAEQVTNRLNHLAAKAAAGRGWGDIQIACDDYRITVGQGWTPAGWQPGQD